MNEWILVLTFSLLTSPGQVRDITPEVVTGFSSKQNCELAAKDISYKLIVLAGNLREQQGINKSTDKSSPAIYYECIQIKK
ncbi:MAG TPA: hypothetical protein VK949_02085 [Methylotenera sp.]|nr:hypothetical protein [Methylotenera sp.]